MKKMLIGVFIVSMLSVIFMLPYTVSSIHPGEEVKSALVTTTIVQTATIPIPYPTKNADIELGKHIVMTMEVVKSPLSHVLRQSTAQMLVSIANDSFSKIEQKKQWITLLGIESKFDNSVHSSVGAIGIGQLMPQFAESFASYCGIESLKQEDVKDKIINATLSACLFKYMLDKVDGNVSLALSAYNSGLYSKTTKDLKNLKNISMETANYISRFTYVKDLSESLIKENDKTIQTSKEEENR